MRIGALGVITLVALFSIAANVGIAITPNEEWDTTQVLQYVEAQKAISDVTGHPLDSNVVRGSTLPPWGPADQLYVIGDCEGLYISNGENYSTVPSQQFVRSTWMVVEYSDAFDHTYRMTVRSPASGGSESESLVDAGRNDVTVTATATRDPSRVRVTFGLSSPTGPLYGNSFDVRSGSTHNVVVITDPVKHIVGVTMDGVSHLSKTLDNGEPISDDVPDPHAGEMSPALSVVNDPASSPRPTLCQSLVH
jgi:hypothetical protein